MPDSKQRFLLAAWNLQALTTASIMIKLSQAFIGFMMIHLYVTLFSGATEETTRYCSPLGTVVSSCCGKWCSKKWSKNRGSHTHFFLCFGRISTGPKQGGIKIIYKISSCKDVTSAPVDVLAQKVLESSSLFGTHLFVGNLLQHVGETVRRIPITSSSPFLFNFTRTCCHSASILPMSPLPLLSAQLPRARKVIGLLEGVETSQP